MYVEMIILHAFLLGLIREVKVRVLHALKATNIELQSLDIAGKMVYCI